MARVLTVDDEPAVRDLVSRVLRQSGHEVVTAGNGAEAHRVVSSQRIDLVTLDLVLPDVAGLALLVSLLDRSPGLRVLVLSSVAALDMRAPCLEAGAVDFVLKPFSVTDLRARVRSGLARPGLWPVQRPLDRGTPRPVSTVHHLNPTMRNVGCAVAAG